MDSALAISTPIIAPVQISKKQTCLLYTSDAADEEDSVDLGGRRIIKKKNFKISITQNCLFFTDLYWSHNRSRNPKRRVHAVPWLITLLLARIEPLSTLLTRAGTRKFDRLPHGVSGSLSIRRFWGKGERWKRKRERAEISSPLAP